jgi:hypothetical protein
LSKKIRELYTKAGLKPPKGKGIHTVAGHSCVVAYLKKGFSKDEAWKRCIGALKEKAIKKSHRRTKTKKRRNKK